MTAPPPENGAMQGYNQPPPYAPPGQYPPQQGAPGFPGGYPPQQPGYPPQQSGYPAQHQGYQQPYPQQQQPYPQQGYGGAPQTVIYQQPPHQVVYTEKSKDTTAEDCALGALCMACLCCCLMSD